MFEIAAPIQSPAKCEVRSVIRFLNAKGKPCFLDSIVTGDEIFPLVSSPKKNLAGKKFDDDDEVQEEVMAWFKGQAADFYHSEIQKLIPRLNKCLDNAGEYVEK